MKYGSLISTLSTLSTIAGSLDFKGFFPKITLSFGKILCYNGNIERGNFYEGHTITYGQ